MNVLIVVYCVYVSCMAKCLESAVTLRTTTNKVAIGGQRDRLENREYGQVPVAVDQERMTGLGE
jgi:hypothetical protein